jgi:hypothetical protein
MKELERLEAQLLERARRAYAAPPAVAAKVEAAALAAIATGAVVSTSAPALTAGDVVGRWVDAASLPRTLVAALALGGAGASGYELGLRDGATLAPLPSTEASPAPRGSPVLELSAREEVRAVPPPMARERRHLPPPRSGDAATATATPTPTASAQDGSSASELSTLRRVERVLREGNPRFALALLAELDRSVPHGNLMEERGAARTVAECQLAAPPAAAALLTAFTTRHPNSVYTSRVREACRDGSDGERILDPAETNASERRFKP